MLNVMIVEDEMLVRLGFKNSVPWEKHGMRVCADVANGREAWDMYNAGARPDIVFTDLLMPEMDGLELIKAIRKNDSRTRIVILSCLEDFQLVKQAMNMGVSNYIVKLTMTEKEIEAVLNQVREELGAQESIEANKGIIRNPDYLKENVLKNFVFYNLYNETEFARHIAKLKLRLFPERLVACMMEIDRFGQMREKFKDEKGELIRATILNVLNEVLDQFGRGEAVSDGDKRYLLLFSFRDIVSEAKIHEQLTEILIQVQKVLKRFFNISVTVGVSGMKNEYASIRQLYQESLASVARKFVVGHGRILLPETPGTEAADGLLKRKMEEACSKWPEIEGNGREELQAIVRSFNESGFLQNERDVRKLFVRLLHWQSSEQTAGMREMDAIVSAYGERIQSCETLDEISDAFAEFLKEFHSKRGTTKQLSKEVARSMQYVYEHYASNFSLQQLADWLQISPNHLSALFKKELQVNFSDYVNRVRLEKAKELLLHTNLKSYEIAERTGFSDDSYFSRTFMKHVGVRPNGFRRLWVQDRIGKASDGDGE